MYEQTIHTHRHKYQTNRCIYRLPRDGFTSVHHEPLNLTVPECSVNCHLNTAGTVRQAVSVSCKISSFTLPAGCGARIVIACIRSTHMNRALRAIFFCRRRSAVSQLDRPSISSQSPVRASTPCCLFHPTSLRSTGCPHAMQPLDRTGCSMAAAAAAAELLRLAAAATAAAAVYSNTAVPRSLYGHANASCVVFNSRRHSNYYCCCCCDECWRRPSHAIDCVCGAASPLHAGEFIVAEEATVQCHSNSRRLRTFGPARCTSVYVCVIQTAVSPPLTCINNITL